MGVYINMEMPTSCPCELLGIGYDLYCSFAGGIPARVKEYYECCQNGTRPSWCPLVPVPEHGRLGDLDELHKEAVRRSEKAGTHDIWYNCTDRVICALDIKNAPTIIPAEEGE